MPIYKDFAGINICIYDPIESDSGAHGENTNTIGYQKTPTSTFFYTDAAAPLTNISTLTTTQAPNLLVILNLHRNGVWSYSSWAQTRASQCPLVRNQIKNNTYSYDGPGEFVNIQGFDYRNRYGSLEFKTEPMISSKYKPLEYNFGFMMNDDRLGEFTLKAALTSECGFFTHDRMSDLFTVKLLTSDDYEQAKAMYLDNALNNDTNPIDSIELVKYIETIYPRESNTFLSRTRQRDKYVSGFWRSTRADRAYPLEREYGYDTSIEASYTIYNSQHAVTNPSSWCLDRRLSELSTVIGFDGSSSVGTAGATFTGTNFGVVDGAGILQNTFSQFAFFDQTGFSGTGSGTQNKAYPHMKDAPTYYHRHATETTASLVAPSGMGIPMNMGNITPSFLFRGDAKFITPTNRTTFTTSPGGVRTIVAAPREPFYDTYSKYAEFIRLVGKDYSVVPEFIISENIDFYLNAGATEKNLSFLTVKGAKEGSSTASPQSVSPFTDLPSLESDTSEFYSTYSNTDFLKMFDVVEVDNKDTLEPSVLKLTCKAIKKFNPYDGFYPAARTTQLAQQFYDSYADSIKTENGGVQVLYDTRISDSPMRVEMQSASAWANSTYPARIKPINTALFSPGIWYNTIKAGIACDWPNIQAYYNHTNASVTKATDTSSATVQTTHTGLYTTLVGEAELQGLGVTDYHLIRPANQSTSPNYYAYGESMPYFHNRIPFEAITNPEGYLTAYSVVDTEAHPQGNTGLVNKLGSGAKDSKYKLMSNNFLAEIPRFFLKRKRFSTFQSLKQGDPNFGILSATGSFYGMRLKIRRSMETTRAQKETEQTTSSTVVRSVFLPQDDPSEIESITMYSRPSAFGPATCGISGPHADDNHSSAYPTSYIDNDEYNHLKGYNFPFTPPYYHGEAWCDIIFLPPSGAEGKLTIEQIFNNSRIFQLRFWQGNNNEFGTKLVDDSSNTTTGSAITAGVINTFLSGNAAQSSVNSNGFVSAGMQFSLHPTGGSIKSPINYNAMQVSSSVNILTKFGSEDDVNSFNLGPITIETNTDNDNDARWIIQSKFETPILNFNHVTEADLDESRDEFKSLAARGLWHQHGRIPSADEGVFLEICDIPEEWFEETKVSIYQTSWNDNNPGLSAPSFPTSTEIKSLADLVGFPKNEPIRMGELADRKTIKEAVIAVPFKEVDGRRNYFELDRKDVEDTLEFINSINEEKTISVGKSIVNQITAMQDYVIPPEMDFLSDEDIQPFAMYMFEFTHELTKQDLSDIWQNTLPDIGIDHELAETEISHELLSNELLGTKRKLSNASKLITNDKQSVFDTDIQWMVFKVKQRAHKSYNNLIYGNSKEDVGLTYNWPYDYFSLVELVKLEAEVELSDIQDEGETRQPRKIISKRFKASNADSGGDN